MTNGYFSTKQGTQRVNMDIWLQTMLNSGWLKILEKEDKPVANLKDYKSLVGGLQDLAFTRLDISDAVQHICFFYAWLKRIKSTISTLHSLVHPRYMNTRPQTLKKQNMNITIYLDIESASFPSKKRSTSDFGCT